MWLYIQSESKKLFRDRRLYAGTLVLALLLWYSFDSRHRSLEMQARVADSAKAEENRIHSEYLRVLDSVCTGRKEITSYAINPRNPVYFSQRIPQYANLPQQTLSLLATGQSDLYNEQMVLNLRFRDPRVQKPDMTNPLLLRFGIIDPAMILVMLLPLLIISLSFNFLSGERESGTLSLVAVQAGSLKKWIWAKTVLYTTVIFLLCWAICTLLFSTSTLPVNLVGTDYLAFSGFLSAYTIFWQLLSVWINCYSRSSAFNALMLVGAWLLFLFIAPGAINLLAQQVHKVPSRVTFINALRVANVEAEKADSSKLVDQFFYDHPELAEKKNAAGQGRYAENAFWKEVVVEQEFADKKAEPIYDDYLRRLNAANRLSSHASVISPSTIFYKELVRLSGTSTDRYLHFTNAAMSYRKQFLDTIRNKIITDQELSPHDVMVMKRFRYVDKEEKTWLPLALLILYSFVSALFIKGLTQKTGTIV